MSSKRIVLGSCRAASRSGLRRRGAARARSSGSGSRPARRSSTRRARVGDLQRAVVALVDGDHRRDVAGAQALECAQVDVGVVGRRLLERRVELVGAAQRAGDVRADVDRVARRPARARTCRRRSRRTSGRRASGASRRPPARSPRASTSRARAGRRRAPAAPPSGGRGSAPSPPRSRRAAPPGTATSAGSGMPAGSLSRSAASSQPGTREPCA